MSVFRNLDCLPLVVCSNTTLLKLQTVLFLIFSKFCASKSGVRLVYGCGLYTDVYGILSFFFLPKALAILLDKIMLHFCMEAKLYMYPLGTMYTSHMQTLLTFQTTNNSFHLENLCSMQFVLLVHFIKLFTGFTSHFFQSQLVKVGVIAILE